jgi:hypothetical protein
MSLDYFLKLKNKYNLLLFSIDEIINNYEEIIELASDEYISLNQLNNEVNEIKKDILINDILNFTKTRQIYYNCKENILNHKEKINENIKLRCNHSFIEDTIDIDPDRCKVINYCQFCGITQ